MIADLALFIALAALAAVSIAAVGAEQQRARVPVDPSRSTYSRVRLLPLRDELEEAS